MVEATVHVTLGYKERDVARVRPLASTDIILSLKCLQLELPKLPVRVECESLRRDSMGRVRIDFQEQTLQILDLAGRLSRCAQRS